MREKGFQEYRDRLMERLEHYREMSDEEIYQIIDDLILEGDS